MQFKILPLGTIVVNDRQRTVNETVKAHIAHLAADIALNGMIHPITVSQDNNLVAGFCRLQAIKLLDSNYRCGSIEIAAGMIPCLTTHLTAVSEVFRVELAENLRRQNLSPVDEARAIATLHLQLQATQEASWTREQTGGVLRELRGLEGGMTPTDTSQVSEALIINAFSDDPEVQKAKTKSEALAIAKKKMEKQFRAALGGKSGDTESPYQVLAGNCLGIMPDLAESRPLSFSGIVCDPPYGIDAQDFGEQTRSNTHEYDDSESTAMEIIESIFMNGKTLVKPGGHAYIFCSLHHFTKIKALAELYDWTVFTSPLIWYKGDTRGHAPWPGFWRRGYECILFAVNSSSTQAKQLNKVHIDVLSFPGVQNKIHSAEKPAELLRELLQISFGPGDAILDPCCGSGSIFLAAKGLNLQVTGIELDPQYVAIARGRIKEIEA